MTFSLTRAELLQPNTPVSQWCCAGPPNLELADACVAAISCFHQVSRSVLWRLIGRIHELYGSGSQPGNSVCTHICCKSLLSPLCRVLPVKRWYIEVALPLPLYSHTRTARCMLCLCAHRLHMYVRNAKALQIKGQKHLSHVIVHWRGLQNPATGSLAERAVLLDGLREVAPGYVRHEVSYCMYGATMVRQPRQGLALHSEKSCM